MPYLVCQICGGYYQLLEGESPDDFLSCSCGGKLLYFESYQDFIMLEVQHQQEIKCKKCGKKISPESSFCSGCGATISSLTLNKDLGGYLVSSQDFNKGLSVLGIFAGLIFIGGLVIITSMIIIN